MEEKTSTEEKVVVNTEKRDGGYDDYSCRNMLICKYPLHEVVKAIFFKCFGFEASNEQPAAPAANPSSTDVKEIVPSTTEPAPNPSSTPGPTEDVTMRFRPPPKLQPSKGRGPQTNSTGNS